ncbi:MAG: ribosome maturation factor [Pseudomonadota bacterium]
MTDLTRLIELVEPEAKALGFELVRVQMTQSEAGADDKSGAQALQIMAEDPATGQLIIDQCAALSRRVSDLIDEREEAGEYLVEGAYHLEVSSPGIDRPLTREKDFVNWAGHETRIVMQKGWSGEETAQRVYKGELKGLEGGEIHLHDAKKDTVVALPRDKVHAAKLVLTDKLIAATKPLDTTGVDDVVEDTPEDTSIEKADD